MARNKLTVTKAAGLSKPGRYSDGDGLYLVVSNSGAKSWAFMWTRHGKRTEMGLGSFNRGTSRVSLSFARQKAEEVRFILGRGGNPLVEITERKARAIRKTFGDVCDLFIKDKAPSWKNQKHAAQWQMTLTRYAASIRSVSVASITTDHVLKVLKPIWNTRPETASRLRGRIEKVLDYARVKGWRDGENPARWRGHLDQIIPPPKKLSRGHHGALPYAELRALLSRVVENETTARQALLFTILTCARTSETLNAKWDEIDFEARVWSVPAERMKAGRPHRVPLSQAALAVLNRMHAMSMNDYIFPGARAGKPLSNMAMLKVAKELCGKDVTVHGFRSSFRDWAGNETNHPREIAEHALAHVVGNQAELAYRRGDALNKRRVLMDDWARYLGFVDTAFRPNCRPHQSETLAA